MFDNHNIGQFNFKASTSSCLVPGDVEFSSVFHRKVFRHPQPESGANVFLGREERFENFFNVFVGNSGSVVGKLDHYIRSRTGDLDA